MAPPIPYRKGLHELGNGHYAYLQPNGEWGLSNAGLVTDSGQSLLVDTLFDLRLTGEMLAAMRRATPAAAEIDILVNSHSNGDHTFGNRLLEGARIVASRRAAEEMPNAGPELLAGLLQAARSGALGRSGPYLERIFGRFDFAGIERLALPTETFERELELQVGRKRVRLLEVGPAHTGGDVIVHVPEDRVVYTADILFVGANPIMWAGPAANWIAALDLILGLDVEVIVPGHGRPAAKADVAELKAYFADLLSRCAAAVEAGRPARDTARELAAGPYGRWREPERLIANVLAVYRELGAGPAQPPSPLETFAAMAEFDEALRDPAGG